MSRREVPEGETASSGEVCSCPGRGTVRAASFQRCQRARFDEIAHRSSRIVGHTTREARELLSRGQHMVEKIPSAPLGARRRLVEVRRAQAADHVAQAAQRVVQQLRIRALPARTLSPARARAQDGGRARYLELHGQPQGDSSGASLRPRPHARSAAASVREAKDCRTSGRNRAANASSQSLSPYDSPRST